MKPVVKCCLLLALFLAVGSIASGATLTVDSIDGHFHGAVGLPDELASVEYLNLDLDPNLEEVRWGTSDTGGEKSGLTFIGLAPPAFNVMTGVVFPLGTLTHHNFPINDPISSVDLDVLGTISSLTDSVNILFHYRFPIDETPNDPGPPASDDVIVINPLAVQDTFFLDGSLYKLTFVGFSVDGGNTITPFLVSPENQDSSAVLYAEITPAEIPEVSTLLLIASGMVLFSLRSRFAC
jgi:hypothetical protein